VVTISPGPWFLGGGLDVRAVVLPDQWLGCLGVGEVDDQSVAALVDGPEHGVAFAKEQAPAGSQQAGHLPHPTAHVREPTQRADPGADEVEGAARGRWSGTE
jgi:hypothetical protein